jgi:hypothetical protein
MFINPFRKEAHMERFQMTRGLTKNRAFAGLIAVLVFTLIAPSAFATSIVAQADLDEDEEEQASTSTPFRALTNDQIQFLEDNWYFTVDDLVIEDEEQAPAVSELETQRDEIKFREDNWYYESYEVLPHPQVEVDDPEPPITRGHMRFLEENIELGLATPDQDDDEDSEDEEDQDEGYDDYDLPHPHGGDSTELDW